MSAFFPSPFEHAAILAIDGVGESPTTSAGLGVCKRLEIHKEIDFPHSRGLRYSAFEVRAAGNCYLRKEAQRPELRIDYKTTFALD